MKEWALINELTIIGPWRVKKGILTSSQFVRQSRLHPKSRAVVWRKFKQL